MATKHHLRGEDGIYYTDLYHLVKFLPPYTWSLARTPTFDPRATISTLDSKHDSYTKATTSPPGSYISHRLGKSMRQSSSASSMTMVGARDTSSPIAASFHDRKPSQTQSFTAENTQYAWRVNEERFLLPARLPPKYSFLHLFPFSLFLKFLAKERNRKQVRGMYYAGLRDKKNTPGAQNIPLEISLYLVSVNLPLLRSATYWFYSAQSSYVAELQHRKVTTVPTASELGICNALFGNLRFFYPDNLLGSINQLGDALTGLDRILTTPIPFSYVSFLFICTCSFILDDRYSSHLWVVTILYCLALVRRDLCRQSLPEPEPVS